MKTGLTRFLDQPAAVIGRGRVGLLANHTAVDDRLRHAADLLHAHPDVDLRRLFGPEHGLRGELQDMVEAADSRDEATGLPVTSLYGCDESSLAPTEEHLAELEVLVIDIQDIGSRYYTYAATMALCMRAAAAAGVSVVVLDRPNPIGGVQVEGGGIDPGLESFVGLYPVPQRHGLTVGELAALYNSTFGIGAELQVVACEGWQRHQYYDETGLPWVLPSPNMPTLETALVYPGLCLLEGTNLSEGRGTTRPFELLGAPFVDGRRLADALQRADLPGVAFRACHFMPTFQKFAGQSCAGVQIHVWDRLAFLPYRTGLAILRAIRQLWPDDLRWRSEAYEFRSDVPAIDLLTGTSRAREAIDAGRDLDDVMAIATRGVEQYANIRAGLLRY